MAQIIFWDIQDELRTEKNNKKTEQRSSNGVGHIERSRIIKSHSLILKMYSSPSDTEN